MIQPTLTLNLSALLFTLSIRKGEVNRSVASLCHLLHKKHTHRTLQTEQRQTTDSSFVELHLLRKALRVLLMKIYTHIHTRTHAGYKHIDVHTRPDIMNCLLGTIYTFQCGANTGGRTFSQRETEGKQAYLCSQRTDSSLDPDSSADTNTVRKQFLCKQQDTLHNATHNAPLSTDCWLSCLHRYEKSLPVCVKSISHYAHFVLYCLRLVCLIGNESQDRNVNALLTTSPRSLLLHN